MKWELRRKGVAPELVEEALERIGEDKELEMALDLATRKLGGASVSDPESKRKLAGFLQRRGFHWDIVSRVLDRLATED
jgi:regulatory protein